MRRDLPAGRVTLFFSDIEGSTKLLHELGAAAYADVLAEHRSILREAFARHGGVEVDTEGDAFFVAFPTADGAARAADEGRLELAARSRIRVRVGLHTGTPHITDEGYVGEDVHKGARIMSAGHGGQVLLSQETRELIDLPITDLGEHRLKDFAEPVWLFQLGSDRHPPLKTISNTNLPRPASSFVGRASEMADVVECVRGARVVTLTGPGGSGKTRLAMEAAAELVSKFRNGVFWVPLSALRDPALVIDAIKLTLGATDDLTVHIGDREMLLLLDNFEQVVDAARDLSPITAACPNLKLLVTSRELLRIQGEVEYAVPPLASGDAVELFCARANMQPEDAIDELCRRLDDLPLAVELAAARTRVLSPAKILERLSQRLDLLKGGRDVDERQKTLRATIEWSYDLLDEDEQRLFARLSVFAGGHTLDAAQAVVDADVDTVQSLVEKSLVRRTGDRFWMLETIREFASERLRSSDDHDTVAERHADHYLALVEEAEMPMIAEANAGETRWLHVLEPEVDNIRAANDRFRSLPDAERALRLAGSTEQFWCSSNRVPEGRRRIDDALELAGGSADARAMALLGAAHMARDIGDAAAAQKRAEEALPLCLELGDKWKTAMARFWLGQALADQKDFAGAVPLHEEGSRLFAEVGDSGCSLLASMMLAWTLKGSGQVERSRQLRQVNLARARELGLRALESEILGGLSAAAAADGDGEATLRYAADSVRIGLEMGDRTWVAYLMVRSAEGYAVVGDARAAILLLAHSMAVYEELGLAVLPYLAEEIDKTTERARTQLGDDALNAAWEKGRAMTDDEAVELALRGGA